MNDRLKLIWFALTAPHKALVDKAERVEFHVDLAFVQKTQARLDHINTGAWDLIGVRVEHSGPVNINAINDFMCQAPDTMQRLIDIVLKHKAKPTLVNDGGDPALYWFTDPDKWEG